MYIIVGGTGHVGSAAAKTLLDQGQAVTVVTRSPEKGEPWLRRGAEVALADVHDVTSLHEVFRRGKRAFLLNPNADVSGDTDREERETVRCLLQAIEGSGLEKVVAQSTLGAQPGEECGDLNVLYKLEVGLRNQPIPASVIRAAYYYRNWDSMVGPVTKGGVLSTMLPADLKLPMVAPEDLGKVAARLLQEPVEQVGIHPVEGPERYSPNDVAAAFAAALGRAVRVDVIPREAWEDAYRSLGFLRRGGSFLCKDDGSHRRWSGISGGSDTWIDLAPNLHRGARSRRILMLLGTPRQAEPAAKVGRSETEGPFRNGSAPGLKIGPESGLWPRTAECPVPGAIPTSAHGAPDSQDRWPTGWSAIAEAQLAHTLAPFQMVPPPGVEPGRLSAHGPKPCASTISAKGAA